MSKLKPHVVHARVRQMFLDLPDVREVMKWGSPHIVVGEKLMGGVGVHDGRVSMSTKLDKARAKDLVKNDPRFVPAKYVGAHGWVEVDVTDASSAKDFAEIRALIEEGYGLIAKKAKGPPKKKAAKTAVKRVRSAKGVVKKKR